METILLSIYAVAELDCKKNNKIICKQVKKLVELGHVFWETPPDKFTDLRKLNFLEINCFL